MMWFSLHYILWNKKSLESLGNRIKSTNDSKFTEFKFETFKKYTEINQNFMLEMWWVFFCEKPDEIHHFFIKPYDRWSKDLELLTNRQKPSIKCHLISRFYWQFNYDAPVQTGFFSPEPLRILVFDITFFSQFLRQTLHPTVECLKCQMLLWRFL